RQELCAEAIRLALLLATLMPDDAEVHGLHALVLLQDARRDARVSPEGRLVLLEDQDRGLWDTEEIVQGRAALDRALALRPPAPSCFAGSTVATRPRSPTSARSRSRRARWSEASSERAC